jgi:hypothetical protein
VSVTLFHLLHTLNNIQRRERERKRKNKKQEQEEKKRKWETTVKINLLPQ